MNDISQLNNPLLFKGKNSDFYEINFKLQSDGQGRNVNRSAFVVAPIRLHKNHLDSDPTVGESCSNTTKVHQTTKAFSPHLIESHDQENRTFRVTNVIPINPINKKKTRNLMTKLG